MNERDNNRGAIWKNERREKDTHPHFTGSAIIDGVEYWVSAWKREDGDNPKAPALKFSVRRKDQSKAPVPPQPTDRSLEGDFNDDLPF